MKKKLIINPASGLMNRFRAIASSFILSEVTNRDFFVNWSADFMCNINLGDIIDKDYFPTYTEKFVPEECYFHSGAQRGAEQPYVQEMLDTEEEIIYLYAGGNFFPPFMSVSEFNNNKSNFYRNLPFNYRIMNEYENFKQTHGEYYGIHLRFTDRSEFAPDVNYVHSVINVNKDKKFFICSDHRGSIEYFKKIYGERIISYNVTDVRRNSSDALLQSMIEWLILANSSKIWYSFGSSFSYEACIYNKLQNSIEMNTGSFRKDDFHIDLIF